MSYELLTLFNDNKNNDKIMIIKYDNNNKTFCYIRGQIAFPAVLLANINVSASSIIPSKFS